MSNPETIRIPDALAKGHAADEARTGDDAARIGAKWAETFEIYGGLKTADRVLDIGCGPGRMAIAIGERFGWTNDYLGFDVNRRDIEWCAKEVSSRHPNFAFRHLDVRNVHYNPKGGVEPEKVRFPAEDGTIDFAFATSVFTHMFTAEMIHYIRETRRAISRGAFLATFFAFDDIVPKNARFAFATKWDDHCLVAYPDRPGKAVAYPKDFIMRVFSTCGFASIAHVAGGWTGHEGARHSQDIVIGVVP